MVGVKLSKNYQLATSFGIPITELVLKLFNTWQWFAIWSFPGF